MKSSTFPQVKFNFLDGIRGLCALYVALYHAQLFTGNTNDYIKSSLTSLNVILSYGHFSVALFIVLSGFCLSIPVTKSEDTKLRGGFSRYISRRFTRILPPYYFALALSIVIIYTFPILQSYKDTAWDSKIPISTWSVVSHLFLIHNLSEEWILKINGPLWSVATEWQIYFVFPILILIWRKINLIFSLLFALVLGSTIALKMPVIHSWYLGLFAMGMVSAVVCFSKEQYFVSIRSAFNWSALSKISAVLLVLFLALLHFKTIHLLISETIVGALFCIFLINFTLIEITSLKRPPMLKILNTKFALFLGAFSYSIYLIHSPILALLNLISLNYEMSTDTRLIFMLFISVPFAILISYAFYWLVERKFVPGNKEIPLAKESTIQELAKRIV
jgi:peptidoglycan/LPS O-acetylase OafA/YrhL